VKQEPQQGAGQDGGRSRCIDWARPWRPPIRTPPCCRSSRFFCEFWTFDPGALGLLHAAGASDPELALSVGERSERRRRFFTVLVRRMADNGPLRPKAERDLVDTLFALTSFWFFSQLTTARRTATAACRIIEDLATDAVGRVLAAKSGG
jgi:hypothetical protein